MARLIITVEVDAFWDAVAVEIDHVTARSSHAYAVTVDSQCQSGIWSVTTIVWSNAFASPTMPELLSN